MYTMQWAENTISTIQHERRNYVIAKFSYFTYYKATIEISIQPNLKIEVKHMCILVKLDAFWTYDPFLPNPGIYN